MIKAYKRLAFLLFVILGGCSQDGPTAPPTVRVSPAVASTATAPPNRVPLSLSLGFRSQRFATDTLDLVVNGERYRLPGRGAIQVFIPADTMSTVVAWKADVPVAMLAVGSRELKAGSATLDASSTLEAAMVFSPLLTSRYLPHVDHFRSRLLDSVAFTAAVDRIQPFIEQGRALSGDVPPPVRQQFQMVGRALAKRLAATALGSTNQPAKGAMLSSSRDVASVSSDVTDPRPAPRFWFRSAPYEPVGRWPMQMTVGASADRGSTVVRVRVRNPGGRPLHFRAYASNGAPAGPAVSVADAKPAGLGDVAFQAALMLSSDLDRPLYQAIGEHVLGLGTFYQTIDVPVDPSVAAAHWGTGPSLQLHMLQSAWGTNGLANAEEQAVIASLRSIYAGRLLSHLAGMALQLLGPVAGDATVSKCLELAVSKVGDVFVSQPARFEDAGMLAVQSLLNGSLIPCLQERGQSTLAARLEKLGFLSVDAAVSELTAVIDAGLYAVWVTSAVLDTPRYSWGIRHTWLSQLAITSPGGARLPDRVDVGALVPFEVSSFLGGTRVSVGSLPPGVSLRMAGGTESAGQLEGDRMYAVRIGTMAVVAEALMRDTTGTRAFTSASIQVGGCPVARLTRLTHSFGGDARGITFRIDTTFFIAYGTLDVRCDPSQAERQVAPEQLEWLRWEGPTSGKFVGVADPRGMLAGFAASGAAGRWYFRGRLWSLPLPDGSRRLLDEQTFNIPAGPGSIGGITAPSSFVMGGGASILGTYFDVRGQPRAVQVCARGYGLLLNSWGSCSGVDASSPGLKSYQLYAPAIPEVFSQQVFVTAIEPRK